MTRHPTSDLVLSGVCPWKPRLSTGASNAGRRVPAAVSGIEQRGDAGRSRFACRCGTLQPAQRRRSPGDPRGRPRRKSGRQPTRLDGLVKATDAATAPPATPSTAALKQDCRRGERRTASCSSARAALTPPRLQSNHPFIENFGYMVCQSPYNSTDFIRNRST